jgi:hypothetical protein
MWEPIMASARSISLSTAGPLSHAPAYRGPTHPLIANLLDLSSGQRNYVPARTLVASAASGALTPNTARTRSAAYHAEAGGDGGKESGDAEVEPVDGDNSEARARHHAHRVGVHRRDAAADALQNVEKSQSEPEA